MQTVVLTLKQIRAATNNFDTANKIGEGGFGSVYKVPSSWEHFFFDVALCDSLSFLIDVPLQGQLPDGTVIAVKQLSSRSRQGNREFLNEIGMISCLQHPNLVKLYGCCIEGDQLLVVYEYMENNSLAHVLFGMYIYTHAHSRFSLRVDFACDDLVDKHVTTLQIPMEEAK